MNKKAQDIARPFLAAAIIIIVVVIFILVWYFKIGQGSVELSGSLSDKLTQWLR